MDMKEGGTMLDLLLQFLGLFFLLGGLWLGYHRWIKPHEEQLDFQGRGVLLLILLALMGGFVGSPFWWMDEARSFSWDLPPLASRMLAAAGWSFAVGSYLALRHPSRRRIHLVVLLLAVYLVPLVAVIFAFHLDYFDFTAPITYAFFAVAGGMSLASLWYALRFPQTLPVMPTDNLPTSALVSLWLTLVAVVAAGWGLALFLTDSGPLRWLWAWPGDPLTSRLIGVMLLAIAVGAASSRRYVGVARLMLAFTATYGLGVAAASLWNALAGRPVPPAYALVFSAIFAGSALLLWINRRERRPLAAA
jgi:hypothetical protein